MADFELPDGEPSSVDSEERISEQELDGIGAKTIELYQNHLALLDRIWVYFSQYSALIFVLACGLAVLRSNEVVTKLPRPLVALPLLVYTLLFFGNHRVLKLTLAELQIVKGIAQTKTRFVFRGNTPSTILLFHAVLAILVASTYVFAWWLIGEPPRPIPSQPLQ